MDEPKAERAFSHMNAVKRNERGTMHSETLEDILRVSKFISEYKNET